MHVFSGIFICMKIMQYSKGTAPKQCNFAKTQEKSLSVSDFEIVKHALVIILCCKASINQIPLNVRPFMQATIIKHLQLVRNDKRHYAVFQALLKHYRHKTFDVQCKYKHFLAYNGIKRRNASKCFSPTDKNVLNCHSFEVAAKVLKRQKEKCKWSYAVQLTPFCFVDYILS